MFNQMLNTTTIFSKQAAEYIYLLLLAFSYCAFWYGSLRVFNNKVKVQRTHRYVFKIITTFTWSYSLIHFLIIETIQNIYWAICFSSLGLILFFKTLTVIKYQKFSVIFDQENPSNLLMEGSFKWIRHPFYTSYILVYLSLIVASRDILLTSLSLILMVYYFFAAKGEEKNFLNSSLATKYQEYMKQTGRFFPSLKAFLKFRK